MPMRGGPKSPEFAIRQPVFALAHDIFEWLKQDKFYDHLRERFGNGRFVEITGNAILETDNWPKGHGVYVVWQMDQLGAEKMLYVGLAGRLQREEVLGLSLNGGCLASRLNRFHPYCFQREGQYANHFGYGPRFGVNDILKKPPAERYLHHVPLEKIKVHCFMLSGLEKQISSALLESLILQNHVVLHGCLPPANNQL